MVKLSKLRNITYQISFLKIYTIKDTLIKIHIFIIKSKTKEKLDNKMQIPH